METQSHLMNLPLHYLQHPKTRWTMQQLYRINKYLEKEEAREKKIESGSLFGEEQKCLGGRN